jgi:hypothetical protein
VRLKILRSPNRHENYLKKEDSNQKDSTTLKIRRFRAREIALEKMKSKTDSK